MFSKAFIAALLIASCSVSTVNAHAIVQPALGVTGKAARSDVKRPTNGNPCGAGVNIASLINKSTTAKLNADGTFAATATNFNGGADGSTFMTAQVDSTGVGKTFKAATVTKNGDKAPKGTGDVPLTIQMPAGTTCTGGTAKNLCLVSFKSTAGFGSCVVVQQANSAAAAAPATKNGKGSAAAQAGAAAKAAKATAAAKGAGAAATTTSVDAAAAAKQTADAIAALSKAGELPPVVNQAASIAIAGAAADAAKLAGASSAVNNAGAGAAVAAATTAVASATQGSGKANNGNFKLQNGKDAQALNKKFATLTAGSKCSAGDNACVGGKFAQCVGGKFVTTSCAAGLQCVALPLVNKPGTSVTCDTKADAIQRIADTGATGGLTGA